MVPTENAADGLAAVADTKMSPATIGLHLDITGAGNVDLVGQSGATISFPFSTTGVYLLPGRWREFKSSSTATFTAVQLLGHRQTISV